MPNENFRQRAWNCALLTITVVCICILVLCGVVIVREYSLASNYEPAKCKVTNITYARDMMCTFCESKDKTKEPGASACIQSKMPCLQVGVRYHIDGSPRDAQLHPDSLQAAGAYSQCSYSVCLKFYEDNKKAVSEFAKPWAARQKDGSVFPCFFNTRDHRTIIAAKMHTKSDVIHSMLWPGLVILVCGVIFLRLEMTRRNVGFCDITQGPGTPSGAGGKPVSVHNGGGQGQGQEQGNVKQTLLRVDNHDAGDRVACQLLKAPTGGISNSMPCLDKLKPTSPDKDEGEAPCPVVSSPWPQANQNRASVLSVDGIRLHRVRSAEEGSNPSSDLLLLSALPKDSPRHHSSKPDCASVNTGSQGSKIMGLETPV